jgi:hypothetical protein
LDGRAKTGVASAIDRPGLKPLFTTRAIFRWTEVQLPPAKAGGSHRKSLPPQIAPTASCCSHHEQSYRELSRGKEQPRQVAATARNAYGNALPVSLRVLGAETHTAVSFWRQWR